MKDLLKAVRLLVLDMASTLCFLGIYLLTGSIPMSVAAGIALGVAQIGLEFARRKPVDTMQWLSLFLVVASGVATLITADPRFFMLKPSVIYCVVGVVMLRPGWMNRYMPPVAIQAIPDVVFVFGFVWSGLMFFSAVLNVVVAFNVSAVYWASFMAAYGIVSKLGLVLIQYAVMRYIGTRRRRSALLPGGERLNESIS